MEKTFTLNCTNVNDAITGAGAIVKDVATGLKGLVWIDSDTHTWEKGVATMSLTVTLKQIMDTQEVSGDSSVESSGDSSEETKVENTYGSQSNPPFAVLNKYYRSMKEGIPTWRDAYYYYTINNGVVEGWKIVDKDRKEVPV